VVNLFVVYLVVISLLMTGQAPEGYAYNVRHSTYLPIANLP